MLKSKDIICITLSDWDEPKRCRHHLTSVLSQDNRVLFVERPVNLLLLLRSAREWKRLWNIFKGIRQQQKNLFLLAPLPNLPGGDWIPWINAIDQAIVRYSVRRAAKKLGFVRPVLWVFAFTAGDLVGKFNESLALYYCNDPFASFAPEGRKRQGIEGIESKLVERVDHVFAVSNDLVKDKRRFNPKTHLMPHGVRKEMIDQAQSCLPAALKDISGPRIGYVGAIHDKLDYELLAYVAQARPDWSILMIGPLAEISQEKMEQVKALRQKPNVHFLGNIQQAQLPDHFKSLDVCLLPYARNEFSAGFWVPLKFFEYLAAGRPIVSSIELQGAQGYSRNIIRAANGPEEFVKLIEQCLNEDCKAAIQERVAIARENTWENRLKDLSRVIEAGKI